MPLYLSQNYNNLNFNEEFKQKVNFKSKFDYITSFKVTTNVVDFKLKFLSF